MVTLSKATKSDAQTTAKGTTATAEAKPPVTKPASVAQDESTTNGMTHYVLMMTLIGAIGITVFISLTKFAFTRESNTTDSENSGLQMPTTPIL